MCTTLAGRSGTAALKFIQTTRSLITALDNYSKHQVESRVSGLVEEADTWSRLGDMSWLFSKVRPRPSATTPRIYQENRHIIRRVAQYRTVARRLYRLARRCKPLRTAVIMPVRLGPEAFTQPDTTGYAPSLADTLERLTSMRSPARLAAICKYVKRKNTNPMDGFVSTIHGTLETSSKVHAEVQILTHLRSVPAGQAFMPRFVQSNKKACFLCNQLLILNGFPAIPKSHGRLYTGWRIPMLPVMEPLQRQLNASLEQKSRQSIDLLLLKKQKIDLEYPYESSALSISDVAASEVLEVVPIIADAVGPLQESKESMITEVVELEELTSPQESSDESDEEASSVISEEDTTEPAEDLSSVIVTNDPGQHNPTQLHPTDPVWTIRHGQSPLSHDFDGSKLMMEYSVGADDSELKTLRYQTRRLKDAEIEALKATDSKIIAVTAMKEGSEVTLQGNSPFHIDFGNAIAELVLYN
jgi:nucleic acid/nucleotide deaminase of polymorphic system toxin